MTIAIALLLALSLETRQVGAQARSVDVRISWLQERASHWNYVCKRGHNRARWYACRARLWTQRELLQAQAERFHKLETRDWLVATNLAERVYPGTRSWLASCSSGEGGHGGFVWNHAGSGSGGWMQFLHGTYMSYVTRAMAETRHRGFLVRAQLWGYYEPLGQALTAAYMRDLGISHIHWDPGIDPKCR